MKALCTGWNNGVQWKQIEVIHADWRSETGDRKELNSVDGYQCSEISGQYPDTSKPNAQYLMHNTNIGKPEIKLTGKALKLSKEMGVENIFLSLSHSRNSSVANVIFEGNKTRVIGEQCSVIGVQL